MIIKKLSARIRALHSVIPQMRLERSINMETENNRIERVYALIDKLEEVFITFSSIVIGLSPFLVLLKP